MDTLLLVMEVYESVQKRLEDYIEELRELCAIDSESYYKPGLDQMAQLLAQRMQQIGFETEIIERSGCGNDLLGILRGTGEGTIVLLGHTDTVYPTGTAAERPLRIEGQTVYGPGVADMKGCILAALYAVETLLATGYRAFGELRFLCVSDEEIDYRHSEDVLARAFQDCDVVLVLEDGSENGNLVSARKGLTRYKLSARGRAAHAGSEPEKGRNAIVELSHQVVQFYQCNGWREGLTINPGVVTGGIAVNVVPDYAEVAIDVRFLQKQHKYELEQHWRTLMHQQLIPSVELQLEAVSAYKEQPMVCTPASLQLIAAAQEIGQHLGISIGHELRGGGSDASYASRYGLPVIDGLGPIGGCDHSPDEYLRLDSVAPRAALLAGLIMYIGSGAYHLSPAPFSFRSL